ncbi:MAG: ATP synthase F0 subunit B [Thermodesulfobacteriota bacterium]
MKIIYTPGMITINETLVVELISFLILVFVLNRLMFAPLLETIKKRRERMAGMGSDIAASRQEAETLVRDLRDHEAAAKKEAFEQKKALESIGSRQASEIVEAARKEIADFKEKMRREVDDQLAQARTRIQKDSETIAADIMERILDRSVTTS